jgi:hypothetical protein
MRLKVHVERTSVQGDPQSSTLGGFDHNFPRVRDHVRVINAYMLRVVERWPHAIFHLDNDQRGRGERRDLRRHDLPTIVPGEGTLIIVRDEEMDAHEEAKGSVPMPDGESSLVLWFNPNDEAPGFHYLDLVTVSDPLDNEFCWWAVEQLWDVYLESKKSKPQS